MFVYRIAILLLALLAVLILSFHQRDPLPWVSRRSGLAGTEGAAAAHMLAEERLREGQNNARQVEESIEANDDSPPQTFEQSTGNRKAWHQNDMTNKGERERKITGKNALGSHDPPVAAAPEANKGQLLSRLSLRERLQQAFPYNPSSKFPGYIWQTWKVTPASSDFDAKLRPLEASWTNQHPAFTHRVIDDDTALPLLKTVYGPHFPELIDAYKALPLPVLRADFFRYLILLARGGIYTDIDTSILKPATTWLPRQWTRLNEKGEAREKIGLIVGIEADATDRDDWNDWYSRRIQFCQWTIQAKRGHPVLQDIVANITEKTLQLQSRIVRERITEINERAEVVSQVGLTPDDLDQSVVEFTGPALWTDCIFRYFNENSAATRDARSLFFKPGTKSVHSSWRKRTDFDNVNGKHESSSFSERQEERRQSLSNHIQVMPDHFARLTAPLKIGDVAVLPITSFSPGVGHMGAGDEDDEMAFVKHDFEGVWKKKKDSGLTARAAIDMLTLEKQVHGRTIIMSSMKAGCQVIPHMNPKPWCTRSTYT